jgi:tetratricopeptide (TPR) repeat protein/predicted Ser/Thr protein kinase
MKPERASYQALLESLADGADIDWGALDVDAASDLERRRYRNLRLVARVAELHRTIGPDGSAPLAGIGSSPAAERASVLQPWGHLEVRERIAGGSYGDVYVARDPQLNRDVALKLLRRATATRSLERLLEEARTLAAVRHPNVVTVYGADVRDGRAGLWMELVHGRTLESWLQTHKAMGAGEAASVAVDLCRALAAVHAAGLVHGDIKPQNVMREEGGRIVLMDFGSGRAQGAPMGASAGTPLYLAPEVLAGAPPTPRSDIYSLGVLVFYLLTGTYPRTADDLEGLRAAHADGFRTWLRDRRPDLPAGVVETVERALEADPARRFATAGEMERALSAADAAPRGFRPAVSSWVIAGALTLSAAVGLLVALPTRVASVESLAVLPFVAVDGDRDQRHLLDGLTTDLVREMQRFDVGVKSGSTSHPEITAADRARLGTAAFVQGELRRKNARKAVTISVVRAGGQSLWSHEYDLDDAGLPAVARAMAHDVAAAIGAGPRAGAPLPVQAASYRAYDAYQRGRVYAEQREEQSLRRAIASFKEAASLDPRYAEPWAGMADAYTALGVAAFGGLTPLDARRLAKQAALNALERDPNLAEAHTSLAFQSYFHDWNWADAEARFEKAIALNPQYAVAHHWYADYLNAVGRYDAAWEQIQRAKELEPLAINIDRDVAWHLFFQRRFDEAIAHLEGTLRIDGNYAPAHTLLARALAEVGRYPEALDHLHRAAPFMASSPGVNQSFVAYVQARSGDRAGAEASLAQIQAHAQDWHVPRYYAALVYTAEGRTAAAIDALEAAFREQDPTLVNLRSDPRFGRIRGEPRFAALVARMRFPDPPRVVAP